MAKKTAAKLQISMSFRDAGYERGLRKARRESRQTRTAIQKLTPSLSGMGAAAAAAGAALAGAFATRAIVRASKDLFELGSRAEETASKYRTVFGPAVGEVNDFLDEFAIKAGQTREEMQAVISTTGAIVQGFGATQEASARFSEEITRVAADLASFNNVEGGTAQVSRALQAALAGEREQIKKFGIVLREEDVRRRALIQTGKEQASQLTTLEKAQATLTLITEKAGVAIGDLDRTLDSSANTARRLSARFRQIKEDIATALLPVFDELLVGLTDNEEAIKDLSAAFTEEVRDAAQGASKAIQTFIRAASVDFGLAAEQLGVIVGSKFGEGFFKAIQFLGEENLFAQLKTLPILGPVFEEINLGAKLAGAAADKAAESAQIAADALNILAGASSSARRELEQLNEQGAALGAAVLQFGPGVGAAVAFGRQQVSGSFQRQPTPTAPEEQVGGAAGERFDIGDIAPPTVRPRREIDTEQIGATLRDSDVLEGALPEIDVDEFSGGLNLATERAAMESTEGMRRIYEDFGRDATGTMQGIGIDLVQGLANGTLNAGDILKKAVLRLATSFILGPLSGILGIFSPSKVTRGFGEQIGAGFVRGMDSMQGAVKSAAERLAMAATPTVPPMNLAAASPVGPSAAIEVRNETPPVEVHVNALFDPHAAAHSPGGQAFIRDGTITARRSGFR